ncbi:MAG: hypothetical protein R2741_01045 [Methanolobus sp.]
MKKKIILFITLLVLALAVSGCSDQDNTASGENENLVATDEENTVAAENEDDESTIIVKDDDGTTTIVEVNEEGETTTVTVEDENNEEYEMTYTEGADSDENCPVGTTWTVSEPSTGEMVTMEIVGTEMVEGMELCHAVYETNEPGEDGFARMEYYWSDENADVFIWTAYDVDGNVLSETKLINGKMTMTDDEGNIVMEMDIPEEE